MPKLFFYRNCVITRPPPLKLKWGIPVWNFFSDLRFSLGFLDLQGKIAHHVLPWKRPTQTQTTKPVWNFWNEFEEGSGNYTITVITIWHFFDKKWRSWRSWNKKKKNFIFQKNKFFGKIKFFFLSTSPRPSLFFAQMPKGPYLNYVIKISLKKKQPTT